MAEPPVVSDAVRDFLAGCRVAHLATADADAMPHVVPVCFVLADTTIYVTIDDKPKRATPAGLKRLRNLAENPQAALVADRYAEDWSRLAWVMLRGRADVLAGGAEHDRAQTLLRARYPQYETMRIEALPVIALRIERVTTWGDLAPD
jgi:PPOX class probable F420-dependent enzyme